MVKYQNTELPKRRDKMAKSRHGKLVEESGLTEYCFNKAWSFTRKGRRIFLEPTATLTKNLLKKNIIHKIKHR